MSYVPNDPSSEPGKFDKKLSAKSGSEGPSPWLIGLIVVGVLTVIFILQNRNEVETHFLFVDARTKVWSSLFLAILLGVLLDRLFLMWWRRRKERNNDDDH